MRTTSYAVAIGSNRRGRHGDPRAEVAAAILAIGVVRQGRIITTAPIGAARRRFANTAAIVETAESPPALLARLKALENSFGRRRGRRWGDRVLDCDLVLWSGGSWRSPALRIPHIAFRNRGFVLDPLVEVAPHWRDPVTALTVRQLHARHRRPRPVDPSGARS